MVQLGQNAGQRNTRAYGYVRNLKRILAPDEKNEKDQRILGAIALFWNIFKSIAPREVVDKVIKCIEDSNMGQMGAKGIKGRVKFYAILQGTIHLMFRRWL